MFCTLQYSGKVYAVPGVFVWTKKVLSSLIEAMVLDRSKANNKANIGQIRHVLSFFVTFCNYFLVAKSEPVNELDHIIRQLRAHGIFMIQIAKDTGLGYNHIKNQKSEKDPAKQSETLLDAVKRRYAHILEDMPPYVKPQEEDQAVKEDKGRYELLHDIRKDLKVIQENQKKSFAYEMARLKYMAKRDANGNEQREKEILDQIEQDVASHYTVMDIQELPPPEPLVQKEPTLPTEIDLQSPNLSEEPTQ
ncbi:hypothetical protein HB364_10120 [Pseudoflavitalea sp. X16]|uniref:hypothetical protein n=1 Tax=Paraflavitalea devenefica TaxID=2716334 RepID=UPI00141F09B2|nr:hypothetical protein [Paraflavitalea devenefica]NII25438.1 hypothetical protein [Paraflavitalea devenefica]